MQRTTLGSRLSALALFSALGVACAETSTGDRPVTVIPNEEASVEKGGVPPDKQAEVQLILQQRNTSTLKCYQDVLNDKHDRAFKGTVLVVLTLGPAGDQVARPVDVRVTGGSLNNPEVSSCLVEKLKEFEFPSVQNRGSMQYTYRFEPAY